MNPFTICLNTEHVLHICTAGTVVWYISLSLSIKQHRPSSSVSPHIAWTCTGTQYWNQQAHTHTCTQTILHILYTHMYEPAVVDCDLLALSTKLWLTGCYRSHLCPLAVCKILDICVYIKEGTDGRWRWRKRCVNQLCVLSITGVDENCEREWSSPNKDVCSSSASVGFQLEAKFETKVKEWVGVGMNGGLWMCVCVRLCTVPQMGWAYVCGFQCVDIVFSTLATSSQTSILSFKFIHTRHHKREATLRFSDYKKLNVQVKWYLLSNFVIVVAI